MIPSGGAAVVMHHIAAGVQKLGISGCVELHQVLLGCHRTARRRCMYSHALSIRNIHPSGGGEAAFLEAASGSVAMRNRNRSSPATPPGVVVDHIANHIAAISPRGSPPQSGIAPRIENGSGMARSLSHIQTLSPHTVYSIQSLSLCAARLCAEANLTFVRHNDLSHGVAFVTILVLQRTHF